MSEQLSAVSHQPSGETSGMDRRAQDRRAGIAFVAAMEREVAALIRGWKVRKIEHSGRRYRLFEDKNAVLICGGIGADAARRATEAVIQEARPGRVISVGFAGALDATMEVGDVLEPQIVVNAADGARTETGSGQGTLVSYAAVADLDQKKRLGKAYAAAAVDMEAAAVAQGAQARGIEFAAVKAISDAADFSMPPTEGFISSDGQFRSGRFALHVAARPWLWGRTIALARSSAKASRALCGAIARYVERDSVSLKDDLGVADPRKHSLPPHDAESGCDGDPGLGGAPSGISRSTH